MMASWIILSDFSRSIRTKCLKCATTMKKLKSTKIHVTLIPMWIITLANYHLLVAQKQKQNKKQKRAVHITKKPIFFKHITKNTFLSLSFFKVLVLKCCWLLYCCWLPSRALLSSSLLSSCTQCYCDALRAQTRWGALEVFFIIVIIIVVIIKNSSRFGFVNESRQYCTHTTGFTLEWMNENFI